MPSMSDSRYFLLQHVYHIDFWSSISTHCTSNTAAVWRKCRPRVSTRESYQPTARAREEIYQVNIRIPTQVTGVSQPIPPGIQGRPDIQVTVMRYLFYHTNIVVTKVDFLFTSSRRNKCHTLGRHSYFTRQDLYDVICEEMGHHSEIIPIVLR